MIIFSGTGGGLPVGAPSDFNVVWMTAADHESGTGQKWKAGGPTGLASGVTGAHDVVYDTSAALGRVDLPAAVQDIAVRMRIRPVSDASVDVVLALQDGTTNQVAIRLLGANGQFQAVRATSTNLVTSGNNHWVELNWYTLEIIAHIADSPNGSIQATMWDDSGTLLETISASGVDTQNTANSTVNRVVCGGTNSQSYIDDISIEVSGETLGPCQIETLFPNGAGDLAAHTRGGADSGANWSQCDENPANADTDYVQSSGVNQDDSYAFTNVSVSGTPIAVQVTAIAEFSSAGTRQIQLLCRIGGVTYLGSVTHTLTSSYLGYSEVFNNNPATGNAWTVSEINAAQFGVRSLTTDCRITQVVAEVLVQL